MRRSVFAILVCGFIASSVLGQEFEKPSKHHEQLKKDVGKWTSSMTMKVGPEMPPMPGTEVNELMPGGMWLISKFDMGPFKGHGIFGYDSKKKKHVGVWVDTSTSHITNFEGDVDDKGVMTMIGKSRNAMTGKIETIKSVTQMTGKDSKKFEMYSQGEDGKWTPTFVINYKRVKE